MPRKNDRSFQFPSNGKAALKKTESAKPEWMAGKMGFQFPSNGKAETKPTK